MRLLLLAVVLLIAFAVVGTHLLDVGLAQVEAERASQACSYNAHLYGCATP